MSDELEKMLYAIQKKDEPIDIIDEDIESSKESKYRVQKAKNISGTIVIKEEEHKQLGLLEKMKVNRLKSKKQLEAQELIFDTQIKTLKHEAEATERQSKAYWDTKSVDYAEGLKTYSQQNMQLLEKARQENKSNAIIEAYTNAHTKMQEILQMALPESIKQELITKIIDVRNNTVERIEYDVLSSKYELGPDQ